MTPPPIVPNDKAAAEKPKVDTVTTAVVIKYDRTRQVFEMLHAAGAEKFTGAWLSSNMAIAEHCQSRTDVSNPAIKELLSLAALRSLIRLKAEGFLKTKEERDELSLLRSEREERTWKPIETAPKDGTEILVWREDAGILLARWIAPFDFLTEKESENIPNADEPDWFCADFVSGDRLSNSGLPTYWMPLPAAPDKLLSRLTLK